MSLKQGTLVTVVGFICLLYESLICLLSHIVSFVITPLSMCSYWYQLCLHFIVREVVLFRFS